jgi:hypothetical protein
MMRPKFGKALPVSTSQRLAFGQLTQPRPVEDPSTNSMSWYRGGGNRARHLLLLLFGLSVGCEHVVVPAFEA